MEDILKFMSIAILALFILAASFDFEIAKQDKIINEQKNKIQQQIELIDALQQGEGN